MTELLSPSPYAYLDDLQPAERLAARRLQEHRRNAETGSVIDTTRRARDFQAELADAKHLNQMNCALAVERGGQRDSLRTMCAELIEAAGATVPYVSACLHGNTAHVARNDLDNLNATLTRARKLLEGGE